LKGKTVPHDQLWELALINKHADLGFVMATIDEKIMCLIYEQKGDLYRLQEMLTRMRTGKKLYKSDIAYVEKYRPDVIENTAVFTEEPYIHKETPKIQKKRTSVVVLSGVIIVIVIALAIAISLIAFTNLIYFHGTPQEGFCNIVPSKYCIEVSYFQDLPIPIFENIYDKIVELLN
jgi:hypothetical protein